MPNGVDLDEPLCRRLPAGWPTTGPIVLGLGRIERVKGFDLLVRAFAAARAEGALPPDTQLVIGGSGTAVDTLRELIRELHVGEVVHLLGRLDRAEVAGAVAASDAFVVPSRVECFGIVALEAWRGGAPLIMTRHGGGPDLVNDGQNGLLADPTDTYALAAAITRVLTDRAFADHLTVAGLRRVADYTWDRVVAAYLDLLPDTLGPGS